MAKLTKLFVRATCHNDVVIRMEFDRAVRDVEVYYQTFITEPFMRLVDIKLTNFTYRNNRTIVSVEKFPIFLGIATITLLCGIQDQKITTIHVMNRW